MNRFSSLDGLRGLFALAVALFHLPVASHFYASPLIRNAYVFVDFFFVLSGFVIAYAYRSRLVSAEAARGFLLRRLGRLWPLHVAVLAVLVAIELGKLALGTHLGADMRPPFASETSLPALLGNIVLVQAWGFFPIATWNIPSWSISAELFAYLAFAGVSLWLPRRSTPLALLIAGGGLVALIVADGDPAIALRLDALRACVGFFAGTLAYAIYAATPAPRQPAGAVRATIAELAVTALALGYVWWVDLPTLSVVSVPLFATAILVFAGQQGLLSRLLASRPLQFLGAISYSVYLTHGLVIAGFGGLARGLEKLSGHAMHASAGSLFDAGLSSPSIMLVDFGSRWLDDLYAGAFVAAVIGLSALTYRWIELPGQRWVAGLARHRPGPASPVTLAV